MPPRLVGVLVLAIPLAVRSSLRLTRDTAALVVAAGACDVIGFDAYAWGARHELAVAAVVATLGGGTLSVVLGRAILGERLSTIQIAGGAMIILSIATLTA